VLCSFYWYIPYLVLMQVPEDRGQLSTFHLKTKTDPSLRNRTTDHAPEHNNCRNIHLLHSIQDRCGAQLTPHSVGMNVKAILPEVKRPGRDATTHFHVMLRKMSRVGFLCLISILVGRVCKSYPTSETPVVTSHCSLLKAVRPE
jgi:hypothetical protein